MELTNEFTVPLPPERAWEVLTDLERIAPCVPGARLTEIEGGDHKGEIRVRVGPVSATYDGVARFVEQDEDAKRAVLRADGRDASEGTASATLTATLTPAESGTRVVVTTDLALAGKVAQFGKGVLSDVSVRLVEQFAECLGGQLAAQPATGPAAGEPSPVVQEFARAVVEASPGQPAGGNGASPEVRRVDAPEPEPVDVLSAAGPPLAKRLVPVGVVAALVVLLLARRRRR